MKITEKFHVREIGRADHRGTEYVVYDDGAYRHVVAAADFDREFGSDDDEEGYTSWCGDADFADDETATAVGRACQLTMVHSATDGVCSVLDCEQD